MNYQQHRFCTPTSSIKGVLSCFYNMTSMCVCSRPHQQAREQSQDLQQKAVFLMSVCKCMQALLGIRATKKQSSHADLNEVAVPGVGKASTSLPVRVPVLSKQAMSVSAASFICRGYSTAMPFHLKRCRPTTTAKIMTAGTPAGMDVAMASRNLKPAE